MLVIDICDGVCLVDEEQFGLVLFIICYSDLEQVIVNVNWFDVGLGVLVWSSDMQCVAEVVMCLQVGMVWVNQYGMVYFMVFFGGNKCLGWGLEFGQEGLKGVMQLQVISLKK